MNVETVRAVVLLIENVIRSPNEGSPEARAQLVALHGTLAVSSRSLNPDLGGILYDKGVRGKAAPDQLLLEKAAYAARKASSALNP